MVGFFRLILDIITPKNSKKKIKSLEGFYNLSRDWIFAWLLKSGHDENVNIENQMGCVNLISWKAMWVIQCLWKSTSYLNGHLTLFIWNEPWASPLGVFERLSIKNSVFQHYFQNNIWLKFEIDISWVLWHECVLHICPSSYYLVTDVNKHKERSISAEWWKCCKLNQKLWWGKKNYNNHIKKDLAWSLIFVMSGETIHVVCFILWKLFI